MEFYPKGQNFFIKRIWHPWVGVLAQFAPHLPLYENIEQYIFMFPYLSAPTTEVE